MTKIYGNLIAQKKFCKSKIMKRFGKKLKIINQIKDLC